jgi:hypothetical protein
MAISYPPRSDSQSSRGSPTRLSFSTQSPRASSPTLASPTRSDHSLTERSTPSPSRTNTLAIAGLQKPFFQEPVVAALKAHFEQFGTLVHWVALPSFGRILVVYEDENDAERAKVVSDPIVVEAHEDRYVYLIYHLHAVVASLLTCSSPITLPDQRSPYEFTALTTRLWIHSQGRHQKAATSFLPRQRKTFLSHPLDHRQWAGNLSKKTPLTPCHSPMTSCKRSRNCNSSNVIAAPRPLCPTARRGGAVWKCCWNPMM